MSFSAHHPAPALHLPVEKTREIVRREADEVDAERVGHAPAHFRRFEGAPQCRVEAAQDRLRRARRRQRAPPGERVDTGDAGLRHRGKVREARRAPRPGLRQGPQGLANLAAEAGIGRHRQVQLARRGGGAHRSAAAIWHVDHAEAAGLLHQRHGEVREAAIADRAVGERVGPRLRRRHHLARASPRAGTVRGDEHRRRADQHHRRQVRLVSKPRLGISDGFTA